MLKIALFHIKLFILNIYFLFWKIGCIFSLIKTTATKGMNMEKFKIFLNMVLRDNYDVDVFASILIAQANSNYQEIGSQYTKSNSTISFHFSDFGIEL